jgi:hypothetical protein
VKLFLRQPLVYSREMDATQVQLSQPVERTPDSIMRRYQAESALAALPQRSTSNRELQGYGTYSDIRIL